MRGWFLVGFIFGVASAVIGFFFKLQGTSIWGDLLLIPLAFLTTIIGEPLRDLLESTLLMIFMAFFSGVAWGLGALLLVSIGSNLAERLSHR